MEESLSTAMMDETYEFSAPTFFDFTKQESDEDVRRAELWFETALPYAPSPFMARIKGSRSSKMESLFDFREAEDNDMHNKVSESSDSTPTDSSSEIKNKSQSEVMPPTEIKEEEKPSIHNDHNKENNANAVNISAGKEEDKKDADENERSSNSLKIAPSDGKEHHKTEICCTPNPTMSSSRKGGLLMNSKKHQSAKHMASLVRNPSLLKPKSKLQSSQVKAIKPASIKSEMKVKNVAGTPILAHENQAIKRQKLEGGKSRQILNVKPPQQLLHKSKLGLGNGNSNLCTFQKEERKVYVREGAAPTPFVSMAEMMKKFQSYTRDLSLPHICGSLSHDDSAFIIQRKPKLTLTRPKEPELETAQRVRSVKIKSTAELEEEMMAKIPKFKARPVNKKILEAPSLPALPRSTPQLPEFQEFHFETTARASKNAESASVASTELSHQSNNPWRPHLTEPKSPVLHTSLRARPQRVKNSLELEKEELEKIPKFKARPLNKKIFEGKGELGIFCNAKKEITIPHEFNFATNERIPPPIVVANLFEMLSLTSDPHHNNQIPRNTMPNPFNLLTEERGAEKERKFVMEVVQMKSDEEKARIPKANPYPYTTDYPVIPPKPDPKPCTKLEPFQLESLVRHEEEKRRELEERQRLEKKEAQMKIFKAQPIIKEDPIPIPEKVRKPLTQVQQFNLRVDHRVVDRGEFDKKIKEKEMLYKRYREESEAARMLEEEKALKQLRRTMVPHARPIPNFNHPFCPQKSSKEITKAKSPNLRALKRKERRKKVNAVSSVVCRMR